jgi:hypothetical protein
MSIIYFASDLSKILDEHISIMSTINSLKNSLQKLLQQKELPEKWLETSLTDLPVQLFCEAIDSKSVIIQAEIKKIKVFMRANIFFKILHIYFYYRSEQVVNMKKLDSLRMNLEQHIQRKLILVIHLFYLIFPFFYFF